MDQLLFKAKLAERAERYEEMTQLVKAILRKNGSAEPSSDIRNLVSVAYKNRVAEIRTSWRLLKEVEKKERARRMTSALECIQEYKKKIETEIIDKCQEAIGFADLMLTSASDAQSMTFLLKMKADNYRYITELATTDKQSTTEKAHRFYEEALQSGLPQKHHLMLSVHLNKAIFQYEVLRQKDEGIRILESALKQGETPPDGNSRNMSVIMSLIEDNLRLWKTETTNDKNVTVIS